MHITIDLPVKDEVLKEIITDYLKKQGELFLEYYSFPEYKINTNVEKEILSKSDEDYIEVQDSKELLEMIK